MPDTPKHLMACVWTKVGTQAIVLLSGRKVVAPKEGKTMNGKQLVQINRGKFVTLDETYKVEYF